MGSDVQILSIGGEGEQKYIMYCALRADDGEDN